MKKITYILTAILALMTFVSCDWFDLDNQEGYNAKVHGAFLDSKTGEPVQSEHATTTYTMSWGSWTWSYDVASGGIASIYEYDWDSEAAQTWNVKNNGTYCNNLTFAGKYRLESKDANYYELEQDFTLEKGDNEVNFTVTPFARVTDCQVSYDASNHRITAKFGMEYGDETQTTGMYEARMCIYTDRFVGTLHNNATGNTYNSDYSFKSYVVASNPTDMVGQEMEFWIDTEDDTEGSGYLDEFKYKRPHYVRIAVCAVGEMAVTYPYGPWWPVTSAVGTNSGNKRFNFSPVYKIDEDGTVSEVTDW